jgi:hypothetical protein
MLERLRDMFRSAATSRALTQAIKAYHEGEFAAARAGVDRVVAATEPRGSRSQETWRRSMRLMAVALRAEVAAQQGDQAVARASIEEGFALWEDARQRHDKIGVRSVEAFESWEKWAKDWLERAGGGVR